MTPVLNEGRSSAASTPPPSTADYVQFHALHRPTAVALVANGHEIVYRQFNADLKKFTHALGAILPPAARSVAIECDELYLHWLLVLACENLGLVTASLQGELISASRPVLAFVDVVICEHDVPAEWAKAIHRVTQDWVNGVLAMPEPDGREEIPRAVRGLEEPTRIVRSSGTTGPGKLMLASRSIEEVNVRNFNLHMGFSKESRFLITSLFNVASMFWRATSLLRLGATCVFDARVSVAKAIMTYKPTHVRLFQYQVRGVLDELPTDYQKPERLTVMMGAGPLPDDMRQRILARLATELIYTYNSNETW